MERDSIIFYRSFYEAIKGLPKDIQIEIYTAIMEYGLNGRLEEDLKPVANGMFALMRPIIDANNTRFANGKKGGRTSRAKKSASAAKTTPAYSLSFEDEIALMKADKEWTSSICSDYSISIEEYGDRLNRFLKHCKENRSVKPHDSFDDAKSHLRYWMDKAFKKQTATQPRSEANSRDIDNVPPDYDFDGGFGGQDN